MKKLLLLLAVAGTSWLAPMHATAQYYYVPYLSAGQNPGGLNADTEGPQGSTLSPGWTTLLTGATTPTWTPVQTVPFPFSFNGQPVSQYIVSNTGVLTFTVSAASGPAPGTQNVALPDAAIPDQSICLWGLSMRAATSANYGDFIVSKTFGTAPHRQHWVQFNSCTDAATVGNVYWSIAFEEGTNAIYLVDQRSTTATSLTGGVQIDATTATQVATSPNLNSRTVNTADASPSDNTYYAFHVGQQPAYDLAVESITLEPLQWLAAAPFTLSGKLRNVGAQAITGYTLNYSINGGPTVSTQLPTPIAVATQRAWSLAASPWQPTAAGTYTVRAWTSNPGGQPDGNPSNDTTTAIISVGDVAVQRTVLEEAFTSSTCNPCRPGNTNILAVTQANPGKATQIKYQQNYPYPNNDPYYTLESGARHNYYNIGGIPHLMLDGGWANDSRNLTTAVLNQFRAKPAFVAADAVFTIDPIAQTVTAQAQVLPLTDVPSTEIAAFVVIMEKHTRNNARTNGETDFYHVMKKMLPDETGQLLAPLYAQQMQTVQQTYTFPVGNNVEHFDSLEVAFFVQDRHTKQVLQSMPARLNGTLGLQPNVQPLAVADEQALAAGFRVFPNPAASGPATLALELAAPTTVAVDVFDALGRHAAGRPAEYLAEGAHALPLDLRRLRAGLYTVRVTREGHTRSLRLVVE